MRNRALRAALVVLALAAQAGAGYKVWQIEQQVGAARSDADDFDRKTRQATLMVSDLRGAEQAYLAEGQATETWQTRAANIAQAIPARLTELRLAAKTPEAQGALETAIEAFSAFSQADLKARDYIRSNQRLSASDVIFADGSSLLTKVVNAVDSARGPESVARAIVIDEARKLGLYVIAGALGVTLLVLLLLVPLPKSGGAARDDAGQAEAAAATGGLGLSWVSSDPARRPGTAEPAAAPPPPDDRKGAIEAPAGPPPPDLNAVAEICSAFARVDDPRELQGLLERTAKALDASGLIVWMPEGPLGALRPMLAYGYPPLSLTRMGTIDPGADNATAAAYRTRTVQVVPSEPRSNGAIVAPLVTADGCSGTMALELKAGVGTSSHLQAVATILAAQLATLITTSSQAPAAAADPAATPKA